MAGLSLSQLRSQFPGIAVKKVEYLTHWKSAHKEGVRGIPTLVCGDKKLGGVWLTKGRIRKFLESL